MNFHLTTGVKGILGRIRLILLDRLKIFGITEHSLKHLPILLQGGASYAISLVGVIFTGRLFSLAEIGVWSLCLVVGTIAGGVVTMSFDRLLAREKDPACVVAMAAISVRNTVLAVGLILGAVGVLFSVGWQIPLYIWGGLVLTLTSGFMQTGQQWNLRFAELSILQGSRIIIALMFLVFMLLAAGCNWKDSQALVTASAVSMLSGASYSYFRSGNRRKGIIEKSNLVKVWCEHFRSAFVITFSGLINRVNLSLPVLICAMMGDIVLNGEVALAQRMVNVPIAILAYTAGTIYLSSLLKVLHENHFILRLEYIKSVKRLLVFSSAVLFPVMLVSPLISQLFLGSISPTMVLAVVVLSALGILSSTQGNLSSLLNYLGEEKIQLRYEIVMGICFGAIAGIGAYCLVGSIKIFIAIIVAQGLGYIIHFRLTITAIKKTSAVPPADIMSIRL